MIFADHVSRYYGQHLAVSDVSFTAAEGEVVGLLGQNGAGKSTIMNVLAGCLMPSDGRVRINQHDLINEPLQARQSLGYLPEVPPVYPELTVHEYLVFCCRIKEVVSADIKAHIEEIIALTGLEEVRHKLISKLSKGFRQRVGLAQALCGDPKVLLLDEPTAGFDPMQAVAFRKLIRKLAKGRTILFSTHLLSEAQEICDRVLIIHEGKLMLDHNNRQQETSTHYRLRVQGSAARVLSPIRQLPCVRRARLIAENTDEGVTLLIETEPTGDFARQLFTLLAGMNAPILELTPLQDTLEEIFLRVSTHTDKQ
ncbi:MAG: ABC transporter ATP-binding protein [Clostridiales bacterium]|nr:ABC transporter ATP-binding protein [Clostridiales bacterium]